MAPKAKHKSSSMLASPTSKTQAPRQEVSRARSQSTSTIRLTKSNSSLRTAGAGVVLAPLKALPAREVRDSESTQPEASQGDLGRSGRQAAQMAAGSGVLAARQLRRSASSSLIQSASTAEQKDSAFEIPKKLDLCGAYSNRSSSDLETCPICLDSLSGQPLGVCLGADGTRTCQHYFHLECLRRVEGARCPQCRVRFYNRAPFPSILEDSASWHRHASLTGKDVLSERDVTEALKAMLRLAPDIVDLMVESSWQRWTQGREFLGLDTLQELVNSIVEYLPDTKSLSRASSSAASFEDDYAKLEDGHTRSGVVCSCGQIHVRRGDRVRRGPTQLKVDESDVTPGQLGTIVRIGRGQESVTVKWDRCPGEKVHCYTWPDPDGYVLAPASFREIAEDVLELQKRTGFSSAAAEAFMQKEATRCALASDLKDFDQTSEKDLRKQPRLYHRARILPDKLLVQQWFDSIPPCQCTNSRCSGGVQWSSRADKHLGREALVLKLDNDDKTVLVETQGPCNCQIWYPISAVESVYDPDLADNPLFNENDHVECKMQDGWEKGVVKEVLWQGADRKGPCPYAVTLDNGTSILVPHVSLIRKAGS